MLFPFYCRWRRRLRRPSEERREYQTGTDLVSQLEELKEKLAKAEVGIEIHQIGIHVKAKDHA